MDGIMMHRPLRIADILSYAEDVHGRAEVVSSTVEGGLHRQSYREMGVRCRRLARALQDIGIDPGDRIATLAWNGYRHLELYYAVTGIGAVCHTINPRLSAEQMTYIVNHAGDRVMCLDLTFLPLVEKLSPQFPDAMVYVILTGEDHMPETSLQNVLCYETLLAAQDDAFDWPEFPEETASYLCYTSGTTGNPKGALYSHRAIVLHALMIGIAMPDCMRAGRRVLPVVPLFHANAWGTAHAAPLTGASLIMPGPNLDGASVFDLMQAEHVYSAWGVPTVWLGLAAEIKARGRLPDGFSQVVVGGSAAPSRLIREFEESGVDVCHAWGMTEMSPVGTMGFLPPDRQGLPMDERVALKSKQGRRTFGVDLKIVDEDGAPLPHDGKTTGELFVRGNTVVAGYYENPQATEAALDADGWFGTGDVASIDAEGFLNITDRAKDLIKSGGEWISSLDVENIAMSHPGIANCAVIAVPHPKWDERPLLIAVATGELPETADVLAHLGTSLAKWQLPDDVIWVDDLPLTATGKVSKLTLRERFKDHRLHG